MKTIAMMAATALAALAGFAATSGAADVNKKQFDCNNGQMRCSYCNGTGFRGNFNCFMCKGSGRTSAY